jgi:hypothetical protein
MSTAIATKPITTHEHVNHTKLLGNSRLWCIQKDCDGTHHFWCSCAH